MNTMIWFVIAKDWKQPAPETGQTMVHPYWNKTQLWGKEEGVFLWFLMIRSPGNIVTWEKQGAEH